MAGTVTEAEFNSLEARVTALESSVSSLETANGEVASGADEMWHLVAGTLVFFMQAGFAMLEAGSVRSKNSINILFKNLLDAAISAFFFWLLGFGFAYGKDVGGFIGTDLFALKDSIYTSIDDDDVADLDFHTFFFQWAFAATAATIVSGSVAERCKLEAYFIYAAFITTFIYPVVVHWGWGDGWLSPFGEDTKDYLFHGDKSNNLIDFAGSGIVHMVGGFAGLAGAIMLGPRKGRFLPDGTVVDIPGHNIVLVMLGTVILWVGWYGFNAGSTLCIVGSCAKLASKVAVTTTLAAAGSVWTILIYQLVMMHVFKIGSYDLAMIANGVLAGLVSVTAPCAVVEPWAAWILGMIGGGVYLGSSKLLKILRIDDPLDACPIHGFCGFWGVLSCGIFGTDDNAAFAGYVGSANGDHPLRTGEQFGVQLVGAIAILAWTLGTSFLLFAAIKYTIGLRVSEEVEDDGLDSSEHGTKAYVLDSAESESMGGEGGAPIASKSSKKQFTEAHVVPVDEGKGGTSATAATGAAADAPPA